MAKPPVFFLAKQFRFEASHQLKGLPAGHPCSRNHGHSYILTVELRTSALDSSIPWVVDAKAISSIVKPALEAKFDHHFLNETLGVPNPTAEYIANWWWEFLQAGMMKLNLAAGVPSEDIGSGKDSAIYLRSVKVQETESMWVTISEDSGR